MDRRTLLTRIVQGFGGISLAALTYPFIKAWLPSFEEDLSVEVSVDDLAPGEMLNVTFLGRSVYILKRSPEMLDALANEATPLKDPESSASVQPAEATNPHRSVRDDIFVAFANCTHLGCEVVRNGEEGFRCPCHQSDYDVAGRVVDGAAAPLNLEVPSYRFVSKNTLVLEPAAESS